jgi:AraC-like DNA-binding protein
MFAAKAPLEELLFATSSVAIGTFRCRPEHPLFRDSGPSNTYCFVFPRTSVVIRHDGRPAFLADPRVVTFYNQGQVYSRHAHSPDGDRGEWFAITPGIAAEVVAAVAPRQAARGDRVFGFSHGPSDPSDYLSQRRLLTDLRGPLFTPLQAEERVLSLLERSVRHALGVTDRSAAASVSPRQRDLVEDARRYLALHVRQRPRLAEIAAQLSCSVFHLCRIFRAVQRTTIHDYQEDLRLRLALEHVAERGAGLTDIALDFGYSSHSHFSVAFRRHFGLTPSAFRRALA